MRVTPSLTTEKHDATELDVFGDIFPDIVLVVAAVVVIVVVVTVVVIVTEMNSYKSTASVIIHLCSRTATWLSRTKQMQVYS